VPDSFFPFPHLSPNRFSEKGTRAFCESIVQTEESIDVLE
jgi:hypothetical protein